MPPRPRILLLSTAYLPLIGGSELAIKHLTDRLSAWDFDLITGRFPSGAPVVEQIGRVRVLRAGGRWAQWPFLFPKVLLPLAIAATALRLMRTHRYALMHAWQASHAGGAAVLIRWVHPRLPFLLTLQEGKDLGRQMFPIRLARRMMLRAADAVTVISTYLAEYARRYARGPVTIIPNGVSTAALTPSGASTITPVIVSVSRLVPKNGLNKLIEAFPLIQQHISNAQLIIAGDGPLDAALKEQAAALEIPPSTIIFAGPVAHEALAILLNRAGVFVRPSTSEGLGTAFLEAMAAGVPVIGSAVGGIPDFLRDGETGLIVNPYDARDIARAIIRVLTDSTLHEHLRATGRALVVERYDWDRLAEHMGAVYRRMTV